LKDLSHFIAFSLDIRGLFPVSEIVLHLSVSEVVPADFGKMLQSMFLHDTLNGKIGSLDAPGLVPLLLPRALPPPPRRRLLILTAHAAHLLQSLLKLAQVLPFLHCLNQG
jgi:hypothetical protein